MKNLKFRYMLRYRITANFQQHQKLKEALLYTVVCKISKGTCLTFPVLVELVIQIKKQTKKLNDFLKTIKI